MSPPIPAAELAAVLAAARTGRDDATAALSAFADAGLKPEPVCRVCMHPLILRDVDLGVHTGCVEQVDLGPVPPPTLDVLSAALIDYDNSRERSLQTTVGPSGLGVPCDRRLGYAIRNAPTQPTDAVKWAPMLGTAAHTMSAEALTLANERLGRKRWLIEHRVTPEPGLAGNTDAYDTDHDIVCDWKLVGKSTIEKAQRHGPGQQYRWQAHVYARGWQRLGYDPKWVRIVFLPRWSASITDGWEWTERYDRAAADAALDRLAAVAARLSDLDVDNHPHRWADVEATTVAGDCFFCPHRRSSPAPADLLGCPGVRSKTNNAVDSYLSTLPASS